MRLRFRLRRIFSMWIINAWYKSISPYQYDILCVLLLYIMVARLHFASYRIACSHVYLYLYTCHKSFSWHWVIAFLSFVVWLLLLFSGLNQNMCNNKFSSYNYINMACFIISCLWLSCIRSYQIRIATTLGYLNTSTHIYISSSIRDKYNHMRKMRQGISKIQTQFTAKC